MKKICSAILVIAMMLAMLATIPFSASATEATVWSGKANIKWYLEAGAKEAGEYHIKTAEDLAGLSFLVRASKGGSTLKGSFSKVYYDATTYEVQGLGKNGTYNSAYRDSVVPSIKTSGLGGYASIDGFNFASKKVYLDNDLLLNDLTDFANWETTAPENVWMPIGGGEHIESDGITSFDGIFDGQNHTVYGAYYKGGEESFGCALFGKVAESATGTFKNLTTEYCYFEGTYTVGGIVGRVNNNFNMWNCYSVNNKMVSHDQQAAGLIGSKFGGGYALIQYCGVEGVELKGYNYVGGLIGTAVGTDINVKETYIFGTATTYTKEKTVGEGETQLTEDVGGDEIGFLIGRCAGGTINVENTVANLKCNHAGTKTSVQWEVDNTAGTDRKAQVGTLYGGTGSAGVNQTYCDNYYFVKDVTFPGDDGDFIGDDDLNGTALIEASDITGADAGVTLSIMDFNNVWITVDGEMPAHRKAAIMQKLADEEASGTDDGGDDYVPQDNDDKSDSSAKTTKKATTTAADTTKKKGCKSTVGVAGIAVALVATLGCATVARKRED